MNLQPARARLVRRFGEDVNAWVDQLPARIADLADRWHLQVGEPYPTGNSSIAIRCGAGVLKLSPQEDFLDEQVEIMQMFVHSRRVPMVFSAEPGAVLMETIEPGTFVTETPPPEEFAELMGDLHAAGDPAAARRELAGYTEEIFERFERRGVDIGSPRKLRDELVASQPETVLLHGDLHFHNIIHGARGKLMVIDPKACAGERAFDAMDYAVAEPSQVKALARAANLDVERVEAWRQVFSWVSSPL
ncbi:streptomycin 6-kinase [Kibdelosporangium banguiense]|uniref:Streptomycin 6-kinase n=1 Tax=Kibdelosporangium banguiense TaxID=1365924 RepID=A0ABS4U3A6_9PSEU|nr:aminoglycoside phosphotransferase family protein [Kibdelosporangium banguiense]MBP2331111.1 streptomycin 6-kinase [Kibdelosporangium banguiense]